MINPTRDETWRYVRSCQDVSAGPVDGRCLRGAQFTLIRPGRLTPDAAVELYASVSPEAQIARDPGPDSIWYVVSVDGTPIAWLTRAAEVVTPPGDFTSAQLDELPSAVAALSDLTRQAVIELALLRDRREQRVPGDSPRPAFDNTVHATERGPRVLVADPADPTLTVWVRITADLDATRHRLAEAITTSAAVEPRILDLDGFGTYGTNRTTFDLPVLCAVAHLADTYDLPVRTVGDWLELAAANTDPTPEQVTAGCADAYLGVFKTQRTFAIAERDRLGWTRALAVAGIPDMLFGLDRFTRLLFDSTVHGLSLNDGSLAVFKRT
jgi:hypothetical protein